jgi:hypothetical protein
LAGGDSISISLMLLDCVTPQLRVLEDRLSHAISPCCSTGHFSVAACWLYTGARLTFLPS